VINSPLSYRNKGSRWDPAHNDLLSSKYKGSRWDPALNDQLSVNAKDTYATLHMLARWYRNTNGT